MVPDQVADPLLTWLTYNRKFTKFTTQSGIFLRVFQVLVLRKPDVYVTQRPWSLTIE